MFIQVRRSTDVLTSRALKLQPHAHSSDTRAITSIRHWAVYLQTLKLNRLSTPKRDAINRDSPCFSTTRFGSLSRGSSVLKVLNRANNTIKTWCSYIYLTQFIGNVFNKRENLFHNGFVCISTATYPAESTGTDWTLVRGAVIATQNNRLCCYINWLQSRISHFNIPSQ
jgi:hypothetical protein